MVNSITERALVSNYAQQKMSGLNMEEWQKELELYDKLDLSEKFRAEDKRRMTADDAEVQQVLASYGQADPQRSSELRGLRV